MKSKFYNIYLMFTKWFDLFSQHVDTRGGHNYKCKVYIILLPV